MASWKQGVILLFRRRCFRIAEQPHNFRNADIGELEFIENSELVCLDAAVGALSSFIGQALIPVPVLGAVIGNTVGTIMYRAVSSSLSEKEAELINLYPEDQHALDQDLAAKHYDLLQKLEVSMTNFLNVLDLALSPDLRLALLGSVELEVIR